MTALRGGRGSMMIGVLIALLLTVLTFMAMLVRFEQVFRATRAEYLAGVARDLAESGLEYEKLRLIKGLEAPESTPDQVEVDVFYGLHGMFTAWTDELTDGDRRAVMISRAELIGRNGTVEFSHAIEAELNMGYGGEWSMIYIKETHAP